MYRVAIAGMLLSRVSPSQVQGKRGHPIPAVCGNPQSSATCCYYSDHIGPGFHTDWGGGNIFSHASTKHVNVGESGGFPVGKCFKFSLSEVDFSEILMCTLYIQLCNFSNAVKSCHCDRE